MAAEEWDIKAVELSGVGNPVENQKGHFALCATAMLKLVTATQSTFSVELPVRIWVYWK